MAKKSYNLGQIYSQLEPMLLRALETHEQSIEAYGLACEVAADAMMAYRIAKADAVEWLKNQGERVTIIGDLVQGRTAPQKAEMVKAEGYKNKCKMMVKALEERINSLKFIGRRMDYASQTK